MRMTAICLICLKPENSIIKIIETQSDLLQKLKKCVPEVEWNPEIHICKVCKEDLERAYNFITLCITSYSSWKSVVPFALDKVEELSDVENSFTKQNSERSSDEELENGFECFHCKRVFRTKNLLEQHAETKHKRNTASEKQKVPCEKCGKLYSAKNVMKRHLKICMNKNNANENDANIKENVQNNGYERLTSDQVELYQISPTCALCGTIFTNKYLLRRHIQNVHATEKKFKCEMCDRTFTSAVYLSAHKRYHSGDRPHICSFCGKRYITASDLYHHEKIHANKRAYRCEICPKAFNTSSDLHKHKICVHIDRSLWKYACSLCDRKFPLKINLDTHIKTHTGEKNFSCHLCDRKCISKSVLKNHIQTHSNVISFKCDMCSQAYKYQKSLKLHLAKAHGIGTVKVPVQVKKFTCPLCSNTYSANNKLQKHIRSHEGERPFKCPECSKCFVDKSYVKTHLKNAHNIQKNEDS